MIYEINRDLNDLQVEDSINAFTHYHKSIEFVYASKGSIDVYVIGEKHLLNEGDLILIPPYNPHCYFSTEEKIQKVFCISAIESDYYINSISPLYNHDLVLRDKTIISCIINALNQITPETSQHLKDATYRYCISLFVDHTNKKTEEQKPDKNLFFQIVDFINLHYKEDIKLEMIAEHFNYSKCYFSSLFNSLFNRNLNEFLNIVRIQNATELLSYKTSTEIAYELGYSNLQSFFYNFKKIIGCTPKQYKELVSKKNEQN